MFLAALSLEVEMPEVEVRATPGGRQVYATLPDVMGAEMALERYGIDPRDASVISVSIDDEATRLDWSELQGGDVRLRVQKGGQRSLCTSTVDGGVWSGGSNVVIYDPTDGREDEVAAAPGFMLVEDNPAIGALVSLSPGDSVTVMNLKREGKLLREVVSVTRPSGRVSVERAHDGERICFVRPPA